MRPPFKLVVSDPHVSGDTVNCLSAKLREAEAGELLGVAVLSMYKNRSWDALLCGEAHRNPQWALSMLVVHAVRLANEINEL